MSNLPLETVNIPDDMYVEIGQLFVAAAILDTTLTVILSYAGLKPNNKFASRVKQLNHRAGKVIAKDPLSLEATTKKIFIRKK